MGIDYHLHAYVKPSSYSADMDYPSTTQALFALIVMVVVLLFILVYCCSGAFPCNRTEEGNAYADHIRTSVFGPNRNRNNNSNGDVAGQTTVVIVPVNGMLYYTDERGEQRQLGGAVPRVKPPAYSCIFAPPPPYSARAATPSPTNDCAQPPPYEESFRDWKLTVDNENRFESCFKMPSEDPRNANNLRQSFTVQDEMQLLSKERHQSSGDTTNVPTHLRSLFVSHSLVPLQTQVITSPACAVPSALTYVHNAPCNSSFDLQTVRRTDDNNIESSSPSCDESSVPSPSNASPSGGLVPLPSNASPSGGLVPPPSNASPSGGLVPPPSNASPRGGLVPPPSNASHSGGLVPPPSNASPSRDLVPPSSNAFPSGGSVPPLSNASPSGGLVPPPSNASPSGSLVPPPSNAFSSGGLVPPPSNASPSRDLVPLSSNAFPSGGSVPPLSNASPSGGLVPPPSNASPSGGLVPPPSNAFPSGGLVPPPSNASPSRDLVPPPSNASPSGGSVPSALTPRLSTSDRQLALRVPDSDVFTLLRDVGIAEDSRRGSEGDVCRED